jgi:Domain of unknown function (DUF4410)
MKLLFGIAASICGAFLFHATPRRIAAVAMSPSQSTAADASASVPGKGPVYVADFELDFLTVRPGQRPVQTANPSQPNTTTQPPPDPAHLAKHLVDTMATKLVAALQKAGYAAQRLRPGDGRPDHGVQIRGLFAEIDNQNHWKRAVIRSGSDNGKINVLIALGNLDRPDQALYEVAHLPGNSDKPGAVITLSPYVPLEKFDLNKDADENAFASIASRVAADLDAFLSKNPAAAPR